MADPLEPHMAPGIPEQILGVKVSFVAGRMSETHVYSDRLSIVCPHHDNCLKSRSLDLLKDTLGFRCAEAYLGAWLLKAHERGNHRAARPSVAEMQAYLDANP